MASPTVLSTLRQYVEDPLADVRADGAQGRGDGLHQPVPLGVVHHLVDQGVRLAEVVVLGPQRVRGAHHVAVGLPV